jgi:glycosyltransferase involved in cell wall biosynthesis
MRVLFVHRQPCIRTLKYATALRSAAPDIDVAFAYQGKTLTQFYGSGDELFSGWYQLPYAVDPVTELEATIDRFRPDVIHCHNLPDTLTVSAQQAAAGRIPVIHDVHDFQSLRKTPYEDGFPDPPDPIADERIAVEASDGLITVSDQLLQEIADRYELPAQHRVIANYVLAEDLPDLSARRVRERSAPIRMVYQGSLSTSQGHYDLRDIFTDLVESGIELHVHPARPAPAEYRALADRLNVHGVRMHIHEPCAPRELLRRLTDYDVGWAGFNTTHNDAHLNTVLPNKAFEYVGCGLPVVSLPHDALADWIDGNGVGIVVQRASDVAAALQGMDLDALRDTVRAKRRDFTMEAAIGRLRDLYGAVSGSTSLTPTLHIPTLQP